MGTFGITDFNSSSALCKDGTIDKNNPSNPCINNGGVDWSGGKKPELTKEQVLAQSLSDYRASLPKLIEKYRITKDIELFAWNGKEGFGFNINQPKFKFKKGDIVDGFIMPNQFETEPPAYLVITDKTKSDAMFRFANGGRGFKGYDFIEKISDSANVSNEPAPPTKSGDAFFAKLAGAYNKNLIIAVVLVAGYFAYKKFKK